jgi:hypothetical protein
MTCGVSGAAAGGSACSFDGVDRVVAVGDVHGAYDRFVEILKTTALIDDRLRWSGGTAHLVQLGDVVDRGPDSRPALDLLRRLQTEASRAGGAVHPLLGNHEIARMLGDLRFATAGEFQAFVTSRSEEIRQRYAQSAKPEARDALLSQTPPGLLELRVAFGREGEYGRWLRTLDGVARINGIVFVHGGISPAVASMSCSEINATVHRELLADLEKTRAAPLQSLAAREDGPFWYRGMNEMDDSSADAVLSAQQARAIVIGHTVSTTGRIAIRLGGKIIAIDTGMQPAYVQGGRASALEIRGDRYTAIYTDRRDELKPGS